MEGDQLVLFISSLSVAINQLANLFYLLHTFLEGNAEHPCPETGLVPHVNHEINIDQSHQAKIVCS